MMTKETLEELAEEVCPKVMDDDEKEVVEAAKEAEVLEDDDAKQAASYHGDWTKIQVQAIRKKKLEKPTLKVHTFENENDPENFPFRITDLTCYKNSDSLPLEYMENPNGMLFIKGGKTQVVFACPEQDSDALEGLNFHMLYVAKRKTMAEVSLFIRKYCHLNAARFQIRNDDAIRSILVCARKRQKANRLAAAQMGGAADFVAMQQWSHADDSFRSVQGGQVHILKELTTGFNAQRESNDNNFAALMASMKEQRESNDNNLAMLNASNDRNFAALTASMKEQRESNDKNIENLHISFDNALELLGSKPALRKSLSARQVVSARRGEVSPPKTARMPTKSRAAASMAMVTPRTLDLGTTPAKKAPATAKKAPMTAKKEPVVPREYKEEYKDCVPKLKNGNDCDACRKAWEDRFQFCGRAGHMDWLDVYTKPKEDSDFA